MSEHKIEKQNYKSLTTKQQETHKKENNLQVIKTILRGKFFSNSDIIFETIFKTIGCN